MDVELRRCGVSAVLGDLLLRRGPAGLRRARGRRCVVPQFAVARTDPAGRGHCAATAWAGPRKRWGLVVPGEGLEPTLCLQNRILSPARLPIPPSRRR